MENDWKIKYEDMLENINITYPQVLEYVNKYIPSKLYRYRKFDEHWKSNIFDQTVYLSKPMMFNDPYDVSIRLDSDRFMSVVWGQNIGKHHHKRKFIDNKIKLEMKSQMKRMNSYFKEKLKVACFSEEKDSILMWSHYADNHKGFCIEYDTQKNTLFRKAALPVLYKDERYDATNCLITCSSNISINAVLFKSKVWDYEKEWRIFGTTDFFCNEIDVLDMSNCITAIYLGAMVQDNEKIKEIDEWGKKYNIPIYRMKLSDDEYKIIN